MDPSKMGSRAPTAPHEWIAENDEGLHKFNSLRDENAGHPIEEVGKKLRNMMPFLKNQS